MTNYSTLTSIQLNGIITSGDYFDPTTRKSVSLKHLLEEDSFCKNKQLYKVAQEVFKKNQKCIQTINKTAPLNPKDNERQRLDYILNTYAIMTNNKVEIPPAFKGFFKKIFFGITQRRHNALLNETKHLFTDNLEAFVVVKMTKGEDVSAVASEFAKHSKNITAFLKSSKKGLSDWKKLKAELVSGNDSKAQSYWYHIQNETQLIRPVLRNIVEGKSKLSDHYSGKTAESKKDQLTLNLYVREHLIEKHAANSEKINGIWLRIQVAILKKDDKTAKRLYKSLMSELKGDAKKTVFELMSDSLLDKSPELKLVKIVAEAASKSKKTEETFSKSQEQRLKSFFNGATPNQLTQYAIEMQKMDAEHIEFLSYLLDNGITFTNFSEKLQLERGEEDPLESLTKGNLQSVRTLYTTNNHDTLKFAVLRGGIRFGPFYDGGLPDADSRVIELERFAKKNPAMAKKLDQVHASIAYKDLEKEINAVLDHVNTYLIPNNNLSIINLEKHVLTTLTLYETLVKKELKLYGQCALISQKNFTVSLEESSKSILGRLNEAFAQISNSNKTLAFDDAQLQTFHKLEDFYVDTSQSPPVDRDIIGLSDVMAGYSCIDLVKKMLRFKLKCGIEEAKKIT